MFRHKKQQIVTAFALASAVVVAVPSGDVDASRISIPQSGERAITINVGKTHAKKRVVVELGSARVNKKTGVVSNRYKRLGTFRTDKRGRVSVCKAVGLPKNSFLRVRLGEKVLLQRKFPKRITSLTCGNTPTEQVSLIVSLPSDNDVPTTAIDQSLETPTNLRLSEISDTGYSSSDAITHSTSLTFVGSAPNSESIQLLLDGNPVGDPCVTSSGGNFQCTVANVAEGQHQISAKAMRGELVSEESSTISVTVDTTAPIATMAPVRSLIGKNASTQVNITASEEVAPIQLSDVSLFCSMTDGCDISSMSGSGAEYSFTFLTINNEANGGAVVLETGAFSDLAGNLSASRVVASIGYDMFGPTYWMSVVDGERLRLVFDEVPYNMTIDDFDIGLYSHSPHGLTFNGFINRNNLSNLGSVSQDGTVWEMTLSANIQSQISDSSYPWYMLHLSGSIEDEYGNLNGASVSGNTQSEYDISYWAWPYA